MKTDFKITEENLINEINKYKNEFVNFENCIINLEEKIKTVEIKNENSINEYEKNIE